MHNRLGAPPHLDGVVGHQAMAAPHQVERALALADAALADEEHAEAEDVEQHAVDDLADGEAVLEQRRELADRGGGRHRACGAPAGSAASAAAMTSSGIVDARR